MFRYWRFDGDRLLDGPRSISNYKLPNELKNMDAVFVWGRNQKTYMIKGNQYWRYNERYGKVDPGYPRDLSVWKGIPSNVNSVMKWKNGKTYFFKGSSYYKLDDYSLTAEADYPKRTAIKWMRCTNGRLAVPTTPLTTDKKSQNVAADNSSGSAVLPSLVMLVVSAMTAGKLF